MSNISPNLRDELKKKDRLRKREHRAANPGQSARYQREWALKNPEKVLEYRLRREYGPRAIEHYHNQLKLQKGLCDLCGRPLTGTPYFDHDHETDQWRGLLHHRCNVGLPYIENSDFLKRAIRYLGKWRSKARD